MNDSILLTIKKLLGLTPDYTPFDMDLIININTFLGVLNQLGVGNNTRISDESAKWQDFLGDHTVLLDEVKTYVYLRVQMVFDPPASNLVAEAKKEVIKELEWRINVKVDPGETKHDPVPTPTPSPDEDKDSLEERLKAYTRNAITETLNTLRGN